MPLSQFSRTELVIGAEAVEKLKDCRVALFGLGGVGGSAGEALVRSGIGHLDLIDFDRVNHTNLNRQVISLHSNIGQYKTRPRAHLHVRSRVNFLHRLHVHGRHSARQKHMSLAN